MSFRNKILTAVLASSILSACGDGGGLGGGEEDGGNPSYKILSFNVAGTSADEDGAAPISPSQMSGQFSITWQVQDNSVSHLITAYVSENSSLGGSDLSFYSETCNSTVACGQSNPFTRNCTLNNANEIFCQNNVADGKDLTTFFGSGVPKDGFIILEACSSATSACRTASHAVQFQ